MKANSKTGFHISIIPVSQIDDSQNIRSKTDKMSITKLAESIKVHGLLQPIGVKADGPGRYTLIFGGRRLLAMKHLGKTEICAQVFGGNNVELLNLLENIQREQLSLRDESLGIYRLIQSGICTQSELAKSLGKDKSHISRSKKLGELVEKLGDIVSFTKLEGHSIYWELLNTPELLVRAEQEKWDQTKARKEALLFKKGGIDDSAYENGSKKTTACKQKIRYKILSNDELGKFEPILIRDDGFTIQEFTYSIESNLDREVVTKKMMDLLLGLEECIGRLNKGRDQAKVDALVPLLPPAEENPYAD